jgi:RNA polymerase sigma factor (sigma-70 family)
VSFTHHAIQSSIAQLEDTYKDPILLKYVEEYSYEEIAKTLNISQDAVRQRISR